MENAADTENEFALPFVFFPFRIHRLNKGIGLSPKPARGPPLRAERPCVRSTQVEFGRSRADWPLASHHRNVRYTFAIASLCIRRSGRPRGRPRNTPCSERTAVL